MRGHPCADDVRPESRLRGNRPDLPGFSSLTPSAGWPATTAAAAIRAKNSSAARPAQGDTTCAGTLWLWRFLQRSFLAPPRRHGQQPTRSAWMAGPNPALCIAIFRISSNAGPRRPASAGPAARTRNTNPLRRRSATAPRGGVIRAFSSEVDTGSREENASKQESRASVLIQSEPNMLQAPS